jgi:hypothetical protein
MGFESRENGGATHVPVVCVLEDDGAPAFLKRAVMLRLAVSLLPAVLVPWVLVDARRVADSDCDSVGFQTVVGNERTSQPLEDRGGVTVSLWNPHARQIGATCQTALADAARTRFPDA